MLECLPPKPHHALKQAQSLLTLDETLGQLNRDALFELLACGNLQLCFDRDLKKMK